MVKAGEAFWQLAAYGSPIIFGKTRPPNRVRVDTADAAELGVHMFVTYYYLAGRLPLECSRGALAATFNGRDQQEPEHALLTGCLHTKS